MKQKNKVAVETLNILAEEVAYSILNPDAIPARERAGWEIRRNVASANIERIKGRYFAEYLDKSSAYIFANGDKAMEFAKNADSESESGVIIVDMDIFFSGLVGGAFIAAAGSMWQPDHAAQVLSKLHQFSIATGITHYKTPAMDSLLMQAIPDFKTARAITENVMFSVAGAVWHAAYIRSVMLDEAIKRKMVDEIVPVVIVNTPIPVIENLQKLYNTEPSVVVDVKNGSKEEVIAAFVALKKKIVGEQPKEKIVENEEI